MQCPKCNTTVSGDANYCGQCGHALIKDSLCPRCSRRNESKTPFCEGCGLQWPPSVHDDSFLEHGFRRFLEIIQMRGIGFTHFFMRSLARWFGVQVDGWAAEELAYVVGLFLTYVILGLTWISTPPSIVLSSVLILYSLYRLLDIVTYELEIVFLDRHQDSSKTGGHMLSADRRVICILIHLLDFMGCYAILYLALAGLQGDQTFDGGSITSPIGALYLSIIVASFTGLSALTPGTELARLTVLSEVILELVLFAILFATVVGSMGELTEMRPRPPRARRIFSGKARNQRKEGVQP